MKPILLIVLFSLPAISFGLDIPKQSDLKTITCENSGATATLIPVPELKYDGRLAFYIAADEALSVSYLGAIEEDEERIVVLDKNSSDSVSLVLSDWDGNSGIDFKMPENFYSSTAKFEADLNIYYSDIGEGENQTTVTCEVLN